MSADTLRIYRQQLGLTQEELAIKAGLGVRTIRKIEAGKVRQPRPITIRLLADAFGLLDSEREHFSWIMANRAHCPGAEGRCPEKWTAELTNENIVALLAGLEESFPGVTNRLSAAIVSVATRIARIGEERLNIDPEGPIATGPDYSSRGRLNGKSNEHANWRPSWAVIMSAIEAIHLHLSTEDFYHFWLGLQNSTRSRSASLDSSNRRSEASSR